MSAMALLGAQTWQKLMTALSKTILLLCIIAAAIYLPLVILEHRKKHETWIYYVLIFLTTVALWQFYGFSIISRSNPSGPHPFARIFKLASMALPAIAILIFLFRNNLWPALKDFFDPEYPTQDQLMKNTKALPYWKERFYIFIYKTLLLLITGAVLGCFVAMTQGFFPFWFIPVFILGTIGLGWTFVMIFFRYIRRKQSPSPNPTHLHRQTAVPARIDACSFSGMRILESRDLMFITLTVFPGVGTPYQTTIRQFLTDAQAAQMESGKLVSFFEDERQPGYGTIAIPTAPLVIRPDYEHYTARQVYPLKTKTSYLELFKGPANPLLRWTGWLLAPALFVFGFLSPYMITGNLEWMQLKIKYFPQKLMLQRKGNFNPELFKMAFDKAVDWIGNQRVESVLFYQDFTNITAENYKKPGYVSMVTIHGNSVDGRHMTYRMEPERMFHFDSLRYEVFEKVLKDIATSYNLKDVMYIGLRKSRRWGTRDRRIRPDFSQYYADIHVVFDGGEKSLQYNGKTGARMPR
ncbi:hypothetical protein GCM10027051_22300 [Niabella terrae]